MRLNKELTVSEVADFCGCHRDTVLNYEDRGHIQSLRDVNNFRRFPWREAKKLKEILSLRKPGNAIVEQGCGDGWMGENKTSR